jgi:hypothetical protein
MKAAPLRACLRMSACVVMMLTSSIALHAQSTYTGKLFGEVTDSSGEIIVAAKTTLTDQVTSPGQSVGPSLTSVGLPTILEANGLSRMPTIDLLRCAQR